MLNSGTSSCVTILASRPLPHSTHPPRSQLELSGPTRCEAEGPPPPVILLRNSSFLKDRKAPKVGRNDPCPCAAARNTRNVTVRSPRGEHATEPSPLPQHGELWRLHTSHSRHMDTRSGRLMRCFSLLRKCDLPRCNRPVVYFRQETG